MAAASQAPSTNYSSQICCEWRKVEANWKGTKRYAPLHVVNQYYVAWNSRAEWLEMW